MNTHKIALLSAIAASILTHHAGAETFISDTFTTNSSSRAIASPLKGTLSEVGNILWQGNTSPNFTSANVVDNGGGDYAAAFVSLLGAPTGSNVFTIQAEINPNGNNWTSLQFNDVIGGAYDIFDADLALLFTSNGFYALYSDNYGTLIASGNVVSNGGLNQLELQYNAVSKTASAWINGTCVVNAIAVAGPLNLNYAGFGAYLSNGTPTLTQFDNFLVDAFTTAVFISDGFSLNTTTRTAGAPLIGTFSEVGGVSWVGNSAPKFTALNETDNGGGPYAAAFVSLASAPASDNVFTVQADVNASGNNWTSIQFNDVVGAVYDVFDAELSLLFRQNGDFGLYKNNFTEIISNGTVGSVGEMNQLRLRYNESDDTASVWINGENVINAASVGASTPVLNYAGFSAYEPNGTPTLTRFDNFRVEKAANSAFALQWQSSSINAKGNLVVDGAPFFPLGLYSCIGIDQASATHPASHYTGAVTPEATAARFMAIKNAGFNMLQSYTMQFYGTQVSAGWSQGLPGSVVEETSPEKLRTGMLQFMDFAQAAGLKVMIGANQPYCINSPLPVEEALREIEWTNRKLELRTNVELYKNHPALAVWYLMDEPSQVGRAGMPVDDLTDCYRSMKALDSIHPTMLPSVNYFPDAPASDKKFRKAVDIMAPDPYPIPSETTLQKVHILADTLDLMKRDQVGSPAMPQLWAVIQIGQWVDGARLPTLDEMRVMALLALTRDVKGLMFYEHKNYPDRQPQHWQNISLVVKSLFSATPDILASSELVTNYTVTDSRVTSILRTVRNANNTVNHYSLIAVNDAQDAAFAPVAIGAKVTFNLGKLVMPSGAKVFALDEDSSGKLTLGSRRAITLTKSSSGNYSFKDTFGGFGSHVYRIGTP